MPFLQITFSFFGILSRPEVVACLQHLASVFQYPTLNNARELGNERRNQPHSVLASITATEASFTSLPNISVTRT